MPQTFKNLVPTPTAVTAVIGDGNDLELIPANDKRLEARVHNNGAGAVVVGGSGVLGATGYPIPAGESRTFLNWRGAIHVLSLSGSNDVRGIEFLEDA